VKDSTPGKFWKTMENYYGKLENCGKLWNPWPFSSMIFDYNDGLPAKNGVSICEITRGYKWPRAIKS